MHPFSANGERSRLWQLLCECSGRARSLGNGMLRQLAKYQRAAKCPILTSVAVVLFMIVCFLGTSSRVMAEPNFGFGIDANTTAPLGPHPSIACRNNTATTLDMMCSIQGLPATAAASCGPLFIGAGGVMFCQITGYIPAGSYPFTVIASASTVAAETTGGILTSAGATGSRDTAVLLSVSPSTAYFGDPVTFTAIAGGEGPTPTGTITFRAASNSGFSAVVGVENVDASGRASVTTSTLPGDTYFITATYSGDAFHDPSSVQGFMDVLKMTPAMTVSRSTETPVAGELVMYVVTVTGGSRVPTGSVSLRSATGADTRYSGVLDPSGRLTFAMAYPGGTFLQNFTYSGDDYYYGSLVNLPRISVAGAVGLSATVTASVSPEPSGIGQAVTLSASMTPEDATGYVTFRVAQSGGTQRFLCSAPLAAGSAACSTTFTAAGAQEIESSYSGDGKYSRSKTFVTHTVNTTAPSTVTLASSLNPARSNEAVVLTARLSPADATGTVTFKDGAVTLCANVPLSSAAAACQTTFITGGGHALTATYNGDTSYQISTAALSQTVIEQTSTTTLVSSANPSVSGQAVTFTATVASTASPTGTITFMDGSTALATVAVETRSASYATSALTQGTHAVTAVYSGDGTVTGSTSAALPQIVSRPASTTAVSSSVNPSHIGQPVVLTATVTPSTATGTVTFNDGVTALCSSVTLSGGSAVCATAFASAGSHAITAAYSGSSGVAASASAALTQTVNDQAAKSVQTIGAFLGARTNQIMSNQFDGSRQIDRLDDTGGGSGGSGFASPSGAGFGSGAGAMFGGDGRETMVSRFAGSARPFSAPRASDNAAMALGLGARQLDEPEARSQGGVPVRIDAAEDGVSRFSFATSLRDVTKQAEINEKSRLANGAVAGFAGQNGTATGSRPNPFDIWVEGKYTSARDERGSGKAEGRFAMLTVGTDYVLNRSLLVGAFVQFDAMSVHSATDSSEVSGHGWMAGPYATVRLTEQLFAQVRAGWGRSSNEVSPFLTYTDHFDSTRWLVSATLAGRWGLGPWQIRPSASVSYMEDVASSYADTFGLVIPQVRTRAGQVKAGPEVAYRFAPVSGITFEPRAGMQVIWTFAEEVMAEGIGLVGGEQTGKLGVRGRAELGLRAASAYGTSLDLSGSYDGLGTNGYHALTGRAVVRLPLN